jgi:hypothetical protein
VERHNTTGDLSKMARSDEESELESEEEEGRGQSEEEEEDQSEGEGSEEDERENSRGSSGRGNQSSHRKDDSDVPLYLRVQNRALDNEAAANSNGRTRKIKKKPSEWLCSACFI